MSERRTESDAKDDAHLMMRTAAEKMARASSRGLMLSVLSSLPGTPSRTSWIRIMTCGSKDMSAERVEDSERDDLRGPPSKTPWRSGT